MTGIDTGAMMATIRDLVDLSPRATGTPGGAAASQYVHDRFAAAGLDRVWFEEVDSFRWHAQRVGLRVAGGEFDVEPIVHSAMPSHDATGRLGTGPGGVTARAVDIHDGSIKGHDVTGAIVLFDLAFTMSGWRLLPFTEYLHDPRRKMIRREILRTRNPYLTTLTRIMDEAVAAGAVGLIGVLRGYPEDIGYCNEHYRRSLLRLPGVWISARRGAQLRRTLADADEATLTLEATREPVRARSVMGVIDGAGVIEDASNETIMVQSHHDSIGPGAVEDASGTAEVIALAEHEAARASQEGRRAKTLMFVTFDTHFTGYEAHQQFARTYALDRASPYRIALNLTVEHVGLRARMDSVGRLETLAETEPRAFFETLGPRMKWALVRAIRRRGLASTMMLHASLFELSKLGIPTDASFTLLAGVPTASLISGPPYLYAQADTLDKIDRAQLAPVARAFIDLIDAADARPAGQLGLLPRALRERLPRGRW